MTASSTETVSVENLENASAPSSPSTGFPSPGEKGKFSVFSGRTDRENRRPSGCSAGFSPPRREGGSWRGTTSPWSPRRSVSPSATCPEVLPLRGHDPLRKHPFLPRVYDIPRESWKERSDWPSRSPAWATSETGSPGISPGWRQRLALGCALLHRPRVLFLDEPTSGVDPLTRRHFWDFIRKLSGDGVTVFLTTHYMDEATHCDRLALISEGRLVATGTPDRIVETALPGKSGGTLTEAFIALMDRGDR